MNENKARLQIIWDNDGICIESCATSAEELVAQIAMVLGSAVSKVSATKRDEVKMLKQIFKASIGIAKERKR